MWKTVKIKMVIKYLSSSPVCSRMAVERDFEKSDSWKLMNLMFDESGYMLLYPTMLGVKVVNLYTNRCVRLLGKPENLRILRIALFQVQIYDWFPK